MPVDCRPILPMRANMVISGGRDIPNVRHAHEEFIRLQVVPGGPYRSGVSHFANCPNANQHRKEKKR